MLDRFSIGTGDRFGQQGKAQLKAVQKALTEHDVLITPVWNKSHREHEIIGTGPKNVRQEADKAVKELQWEGNYYVDADHITGDIVDPYIPCSDFFTIDVADFIGARSDSAEREAFIQKNSDYLGTLSIPGIGEEFKVTESFLANWADQYLRAIRRAAEIYRLIKKQKSGEAVFEISMDEVETPQTPLELYFILKTAAEQGIALHTIAPKFTGSFYKGVDYEGEVEQFLQEFEQDILVIRHAVEEFDLPADLKLSIHSGSDKFMLYPPIHRLIEQHETGIHLKTSGTTWLEELIGLAESGPEGLAIVREIYSAAYERYDELTRPYAPVINVKKDRLPDPETFCDWDGKTVISKLEHNPDNPDFDDQLRQFLHCSYKIAAEKKDRFLKLLRANSETVGRRVTRNLFDRHIKPLFLDEV